MKCYLSKSNHEVFMWFKASAPGSLMMLGEYAVLEGYPALVCAVDKRISVTLVPRVDKKIYLESHLGTLQTLISDIQIIKPFEFVLTALKKYESYFNHGFDIHIHAEFSNMIGFASSAAVTVATLSVILNWLGISYSPKHILKEARDIIREVQGVGSGTDVAAAVYGGIVAYQPDDLEIEKFCDSYPLTVIYSGSKTPTPQAIRQVKQKFIGKQKELLQIFHTIGNCAQQGIQAMMTNNWKKLGEVMNAQQHQMEALGVSTPILNNIIEILDNDNAILGAKISGSGFGDCVIGLGSSEKKGIENGVPLKVAITMQGVNCSSGMFNE
jgi:mevalonate kinase